MSQFMELVEWLDESGAEIVHRVPEEGSGELKLGAQLVVRDSQAAVLFRNGRGLDVFGPGRHTLSTMNLPVLTKVLSLPWGFKSPFRAEVYFVNLKVFTQLRWGTKDPVAFRDRELGLVRLRAFGVYTMRIVQPLLFVNSVVGTRGAFATADIEDYLREVIVSRLNDYLGENLGSVLDLPREYDEMGAAVRARLATDFSKYGIELVDFLVSRVTPPEEVQRSIDDRAGMAAAGDLAALLRFKAANAIADAASAQGDRGAGSAASAGLGVGAGAGLGMMLPAALWRTVAGDGMPGGGPSGPLATVAGEGGPAAGGAPGSSCPECHAVLGAGARFCASCGHQIVVVRKCPRCDKNLTAQANFCSACGLDLKRELCCESCATRLPPGTRFCFQCGAAVGAAPGAPSSQA